MLVGSCCSAGELVRAYFGHHQLEKRLRRAVLLDLAKRQLPKLKVGMKVSDFVHRASFPAGERTCIGKRLQRENSIGYSPFQTTLITRMEQSASKSPRLSP